MTITANGIAVTSVVFNGVDCDKVYMNGVPVFEKAKPMLTVGAWTEGGNANIPVWGLRQTGGTDIASQGWLTDDSVQGSTAKAYSFKWSKQTSGFKASIVLKTPGQYPTTVRVTIGLVTLLFTTGSYGTYGMDPTPAQLDALPLSGTHPVLFEAIP